MAPSRTVRFSSSVLPVVALVGFVTAVAVLSVLAHLQVFGADIDAYPDHLSTLLSVPFDGVIILGTVAVLRHEDVTLEQIGLDRATIVPGIAAFALLWVWVSVVGVGYLVATGASPDLGLHVSMPWYWVPVWFLLMLTVANGLSEELVFRGYLQSKCTALASRDPRLPPSAVGIVAAALLFGVPHVPLALVLLDLSPGQLPVVFLANLVPGLGYGVVYYLTRNVWYTGFVHGFGNATVVPFDPAGVPAFRTVAVVSGIVLALGYRRWARDADHPPVDVRDRVISDSE